VSLSIWQRTRRVHERKIKRLEKARKTLGLKEGPEFIVRVSEAIRIEQRNFQRSFTPRKQETLAQCVGPKRRLRSLDLIQGLVPPKNSKGRVDTTASRKDWVIGRSGKILKRITQGVVGRLNRHGAPVL
jgi:hypothetical protein